MKFGAVSFAGANLSRWCNLLICTYYSQASGRSERWFASLRVYADGAGALLFCLYMSAGGLRILRREGRPSRHSLILIKSLVLLRDDVNRHEMCFFDGGTQHERLVKCH